MKYPSKSSIFLAPVAAVCGLLGFGSTARAHDVRAQVSPSGFQFISQEVPGYVPTHLDFPPAAQSKFCASVELKDLMADLHVEWANLDTPVPGKLRLRFGMSIAASANIHAVDIVFCIGDLDCRMNANVAYVEGSATLDISVKDGKPYAVTDSAELGLALDDFEIALSECWAGDAASWALEFFKSKIRDYVAGKIQSWAKDELPPKIEALLGQVKFDGEIGATKVGADLKTLMVGENRLNIAADVDVYTPNPPSECIKDMDPGEPEDISGEPADLSAGPDSSHIGLAVNFGGVNDALYHVWRRGFACMTGEQIEGLGAELPLSMVADLLPNAQGSTVSIETLLKKPITVKGEASGDAEITLNVQDLVVSLIVNQVDGVKRRIDIEASLTATAKVSIDPQSNALMAQIAAFTMDKLKLDPITVSQLGFDANQLRSLITNILVPSILAQVGQMPITGPIFEAGQYAVIINDLSTNEAYLNVKADLFHIPANDFEAPDTSIFSYPTTIVKPEDAVIFVTGNDSLVPQKLLKFAVTINNQSKAPSFVREIKVGKPGESGTYNISVAAVDLSGNQDGTPANVSVIVDGIKPSVRMGGQRVRTESGEFDIAWQASDDTTPTESLITKIEIYHLVDSKDPLSGVLLTTEQLPPGQTTHHVAELQSDRLYSVEVHVIDQAGNDASSSVLVDLRSEGGGCSTGMSAATFSGMLALALAGFAFGGWQARRRARQLRTRN